MTLHFKPGKSPDDFDAFLRGNLNCTIQLEAGLYMTRGYASFDPGRGSWINSNTRIRGAGPETVIQLVDPPPSGWVRVLSNPVHADADTATTGCSVEDLTVDCVGVSRSLAHCTQAVYLTGRNCLVRGVTFTYMCNYTPNNSVEEAFGITLTDNQYIKAVNNRIENCHYRGPLYSFDRRQFTLFHSCGQYDWSVGNVVSGCTVDVSRSPDDQWYGNAFGMGGNKDITVRDNRVDGYLIGVFADTGQLDGVAVRNNIIRGKAGVVFGNTFQYGFGYSKAKQVWRNFVIQGNVIMVPPGLVSTDWTQSGIMFGRDSVKPGLDNVTENITIGANVIGAQGDISKIKKLYNGGIITNTRGPFAKPLKTIRLKCYDNDIEPKFGNSAI